MIPFGSRGNNSFARLTILKICSGGRLIAGETDMLATRPEPDNISLRMPLIPRRNRVLVPKEDPLAHVERSWINPVYVSVLRDACPSQNYWWK